MFIVDTNLERGLIVLRDSVPTKLTVANCAFDNSGSESPYADQMQSVIQLSSAPAVSIELLSSTFIGLRTTGNMISVLSEAGTRLLEENPFAENMAIEGCQFVRCASNDMKVLFMYINAVSFSLVENSFTLSSEVLGQMPVAVHVHGKNSRIENTQFTIAERALYPGIISLTCADGAEVEFYNCCFTKHQTFTANYPLYVDVIGPGASVVFSAVCFDADSQDSAVRNDGAVVRFVDSSFGDCVCWELASSDTLSLSESSEELTSTGEVETSESEAVPSSSAMSTVTEEPGPDAGSGKSVNAGLIAGVVIALILIIVIIVIVIIILIRRRGRQNTHEEGDVDEEFTEETVATLSTKETEDNWNNVTEDNPVFSTENFEDEDNAFANAFEEQGFFDASD